MRGVNGMFSAIVPVYNGADVIEKAIESVFAQTCSDWELIIVNDGSLDKTAEVLKKYHDVPRVKIITQENAGVSAARNRGVAESCGSHIAFLDADDIWHDDHLEVMEKLTEKYPSAGLYGSFHAHRAREWQNDRQERILYGTPRSFAR